MTLQMAYDEKYHEGLTHGRENGIIEEKEGTARRMLSSGKYSDIEISEITGLSPEQIRVIKKSI